VAKQADAKDLKSFVPEGTCGFDPRPGHHENTNLSRFRFVERWRTACVRIVCEPLRPGVVRAVTFNLAVRYDATLSAASRRSASLTML
jgi:hypothetical protein